MDQRRLRLLNAVCLGAAKVGLKASLWRKEDATFYLQSDEVSLPLIVRKLVRKGKSAESDNRLSIVVGQIPDYGGDVVAQWDDMEEQKLESIITDVVVDIAVLMESRYREQLIQRHQRLLKDHAENIEKQRLAKIEAERREREHQEKLARERIESLLADADQLRRAQAIRSYVADVERLQQQGEITIPGDTVTRWCKWAHAEADRIDPVKNGSFGRQLAKIDDLDKPQAHQ